ncbi:MAG TPA: hypothetical protein DDZ53_03675, partial [Firmicutes bacterium]|nr:hypothetical protein [Bacillota bacterium]
MPFSGDTRSLAEKAPHLIFRGNTIVEAIYNITDLIYTLVFCAQQNRENIAFIEIEIFLGKSYGV